MSVAFYEAAAFRTASGLPQCGIPRVSQPLCRMLAPATAIRWDPRGVLRLCLWTAIGLLAILAPPWLWAVFPNQVFRIT